MVCVDSEDVIENGRVSYWESRKVNIGDYEGNDFGLTISHTIIKPKSGYGDTKIEISASEDVSVNGDIKELNERANTVIKMVRKKLDSIEKKIRTQTMNWEGVSFDTEKKLVVREIIEKSEYTGSHKKKFMITDEDLENE